MWFARFKQAIDGAPPAAIVSASRGKGNEDFYFFCRGRQERKCDLPYLAMENVEREVERHYAAVSLSKDFRESVRKQLNDTLDAELHAFHALRQGLKLRLEQLAARED